MSKTAHHTYTSVHTSVTPFDEDMASPEAELPPPPEVAKEASFSIGFFVDEEESLED